MHILFFDIDGTLLRSGGAGQSAMEEAISTEFQIPLRQVEVDCAGRTDSAICRDFFAHFEIEHTEANLQRFQRAYFEHLPRHLSRKDGIMLPGVPELLAALHELEHVSMGLLTGNLEQGARLKLQHFGIDHYFPWGGFGDIHPDRNDVARSALASARAWHREPLDENKFWVIGDTVHDVTCGRAIGAKVIAVDTGFCDTARLKAAGPDYFFDDLSQTEAFLELLR